LVVLFIVYTVFCDAFHTRLFSAFSLNDLLVTLLLTAAVLASALWSAHLFAHKLGLDDGQRIAVTFVGSTKSLAIGVPMAAVVFGPDRDLGRLLLPLLMYHPLQLLVGGWVASRHRHRP
jgi:sodium/bile acid cotransporter 7